MRNQIPAGEAVPGSKYETPKGVIVTCRGRASMPGYVALENAAGSILSVPGSYQLTELDQNADTVDALLCLPRHELGAALVEQPDEILDALYDQAGDNGDEDAQAFVSVEWTRREQADGAGEAPAVEQDDAAPAVEEQEPVRDVRETCPFCDRLVDLERSNLSAEPFDVFVVHRSPTTGGPCEGSGHSPSTAFDLAQEARDKAAADAEWQRQADEGDEASDDNHAGDEDYEAAIKAGEDEEAQLGELAGSLTTEELKGWLEGDEAHQAAARDELEYRRNVGAKPTAYFEGKQARADGEALDPEQGDDWREGWQAADDLIRAGHLVPADSSKPAANQDTDPGSKDTGDDGAAYLGLDRAGRIAELIGSVRSSRAALKIETDVAILVEAVTVAQAAGGRKVTIVSQLEARIAKLGGVPEQEAGEADPCDSCDETPDDCGAECVAPTPEEQASDLADHPPARCATCTAAPCGSENCRHACADDLCPRDPRLDLATLSVHCSNTRYQAGQLCQVARVECKGADVCHLETFDGQVIGASDTTVAAEWTEDGHRRSAHFSQADGSRSQAGNTVKGLDYRLAGAWVEHVDGGYRPVLAHRRPLDPGEHPDWRARDLEYADAPQEQDSREPRIVEGVVLTHVSLNPDGSYGIGGFERQAPPASQDAPGAADGSGGVTTGPEVPEAPVVDEAAQATPDRPAPDPTRQDPPARCRTWADQVLAVSSARALELIADSGSAVCLDWLKTILVSRLHQADRTWSEDQRVRHVEAIHRLYLATVRRLAALEPNDWTGDENRAELARLDQEQAGTRGHRPESLIIDDPVSDEQPDPGKVREWYERPPRAVRDWIGSDFGQAAPRPEDPIFDPPRPAVSVGVDHGSKDGPVVTTWVRTDEQERQDVQAAQAALDALARALPGFRRLGVHVELKITT